MQLVTCRAIVAACVAVLLAGGNVAFARPSHYHHSAHRSAHHHHHYARHNHARHVRDYVEAPTANYIIPGRERRRNTRSMDRASALPSGFAQRASITTAWRGRALCLMRAPRSAVSAAVRSSPTLAVISAPTQPVWRSLWCGAFMDKVLRETGHRGGGNLAKGYLHYGQRVAGPQVGAIAVMGRRGGGHVGVVSGVDESGNPIIISGNHNRTVAESRIHVAASWLTSCRAADNGSRRSHLRAPRLPTAIFKIVIRTAAEPEAASQRDRPS